MSLLDTLPDLGQFQSDPAIRNETENKDLFAVCRALVMADWLNRFPYQTERLKELIDQRYLFAKPIEKAPALCTINSIGLGICRMGRVAKDGTYLGAYAIVIGFLPIFPLREYIVAPGDSALSYRFLARVPFGPRIWIWNRAVSALILGLVPSLRASSCRREGTREEGCTTADASDSDL